MICFVNTMAFPFSGLNLNVKIIKKINVNFTHLGDVPIIMYILHFALNLHLLPYKRSQIYLDLCKHPLKTQEIFLPCNFPIFLLSRLFLVQQIVINYFPNLYLVEETRSDLSTVSILTTSRYSRMENLLLFSFSWIQGLTM